MIALPPISTELARIAAAWHLARARGRVAAYNAHTLATRDYDAYRNDSHPTPSEIDARMFAHLAGMRSRYRGTLRAMRGPHA